jgi:hypothetical protein
MRSLRLLCSLSFAFASASAHSLHLQEVPSFLDRMKENYEYATLLLSPLPLPLTLQLRNLKTLTAEKYRQLFPPAPAEPSNRRQSLIE